MFKLTAQDNQARAGKLKTKHGTVETPFFMPIATKGTAKQVSPEELKNLGSQAIIANAFVLHLKPGLEVIRNFKGIHNFMQWDKTIFTDSGGFQILSKSFLHKADEKGVYFKNPFDGSKKFFTPEDVIKIEDRQEFLTRMHQMVMAKIQLGKKKEDTPSFTYNAYWKDEEETKSAQELESRELLKTQLLLAAKKIGLDANTLYEAERVIDGETKGYPDAFVKWIENLLTMPIDKEIWGIDLIDYLKGMLKRIQ